MRIIDRKPTQVKEIQKVNDHDAASGPMVASRIDSVLTA